MRVLRWALESGGFKVPEGKYFLVDAGYANTPQFLAPYRGIRYCCGMRVMPVSCLWYKQVLLWPEGQHMVHRDGKAPASPVPPSPPAPHASPPTFSPDYWDDFYIGWKMALQKASRLYDHKGLMNILPDIGPRAEHIASSPPSLAHSSSSPPSSTDWSGY
ncbi:hypothetical protein Taro_022215 [Colocasia esculenta]|uniref:DDE Tnp4 domain-containing protein n=1 Tax=Colocasia esculenta TaxID=4460 RepID=A0A843VAP2_COLES|nr:hypothetical protein [Colocasia esculenta]